MTPADLLPLALAAIEDADARLVFADALEESGWWDDRLDAFYQAAIRSFDGSRWAEPRAIAAVLLFGGWSAKMWPAARRCLDPMGLILFGVDRTIMQQMERLGSIGIDAEALSDYLRSPAPTPARQGRRRRPR